MKIAAISDIHGNLAALDAVLADARAAGADLVVNLGDILSGPLQPAETADRLIALDLPTIAGNHERQLLEDDPAMMGPSDAFAHARLAPRHFEWLRSLPPTRWVHEEVFACHGTPGSDLEFFLETLVPGGNRAASLAEAGERAGTVLARVLLCGHSHMPRAVRLGDGRLVVNPGSVGLPAIAETAHPPYRLETGSPHARYALIGREAGEWQAELRQVTYDWESAAVLADAAGRPDWSVALRTGFA